MGRVLNVPPVNLARVIIPHEVSELFPRELAHNHKVVPVSRLENKLFLAMADPLNVLAIDDVRRITKLEVAPLIAAEKPIVDKLNALDAAKSGSMEDIIKDAAKQAEKKRRRTPTIWKSPRTRWRRSTWTSWPPRAKKRRSSSWPI